MFAGFTTTPIDGAIGSREQMHAQCSAAFPSGHLCHIAEYDLATSATPIPAAGAWLDSSGAADGAFTTAIVIDEVAGRDLGRYTGRLDNGNCDDWSTTSLAQGLLLEPAGAVLAACNTTHVLACCTSPYREHFRGFTAATVTGAAGGRSQMHLRCNQELAGSHLCHIAEYQRATSSLTPPVSGAWVDASGYATPSGGVIETGVASSHLGRWTARPFIGTGVNCDNWTTTASPVEGLTVQRTGAFLGVCSTARPLACCD